MSVINNNTGVRKYKYCPPGSTADHCAFLFAQLADEAGLRATVTGATAKVYYNALKP
jgi:hypothetical protein